MTLGGYADRVAHIDLTTGSIKYDSIPEDWKHKYIGARSIGDKYVFENGPQVEPLSPENILCFMNGPLTGTEVNLSGRMGIVTKSPQTGTIRQPPRWLVGSSPALGRLRWPDLQG